jgi:hypothetical protein
MPPEGKGRLRRGHDDLHGNAPDRKSCCCSSTSSLLVKATKPASSERPSENAWRDLYLAALFETDRSKLLERIAEAEYVLSLRDRELWYLGGDHSKEKLAGIPNSLHRFFSFAIDFAKATDSVSPH